MLNKHHIKKDIQWGVHDQFPNVTEEACDLIVDNPLMLLYDSVLHALVDVDHHLQAPSVRIFVDCVNSYHDCSH